MRPVGETVDCIERRRLEVRDVQRMREHYVRTAQAWLAHPRGALGRGRRAGRRGGGPGLAALPGRRRAGVRGGPDGRRPDPRAKAQRGPRHVLLVAAAALLTLRGVTCGVALRPASTGGGHRLGHRLRPGRRGRVPYLDRPRRSRPGARWSWPCRPCGACGLRPTSPGAATASPRTPATRTCSTRPRAARTCTRCGWSTCSRRHPVAGHRPGPARHP